MNWKDQLSKLEQRKDWKSAIVLMQDTISQNDSNIDAYLIMNYLLMNLLVEEHYNPDEHDFYAGLLKKYFVKSYAKFSDNPGYLFFIGKIACMSEWYFDIEIEEAQSMMKRAADLEPENTLYNWANFSDLDMRDSINRKKLIQYARQALSEPRVKEELSSKGALGTYLWEALEYWSQQDEQS